MPSVRIYAFAKELGLDNKQLLDICESCGIKGKGSALASLDEDEIAKIKSHMSKGPAEVEEPVVDEKAPIREAPLPPPNPTTPVRNDNLVGRRDSGVRDLNQRKKPAGDAPKKEKKEPRKKGGLNVKLAQMPNV